MGNKVTCFQKLWSGRGKEGRCKEANSRVKDEMAVYCSAVTEYSTAVQFGGNCGLSRQQPHTMDTGYVKVTGLEEEKEGGSL